MISAQELNKKTKVGTIYRSPAGIERKVLSVANGSNVEFAAIDGNGGTIVYTFHDLITMNYRIIK